MKKTQVKELCVIRNNGYIVATAWIDYEDLFTIDDVVSAYIVKHDSWGTLSIITEHGDTIIVPCHYIDT